MAAAVTSPVGVWAIVLVQLAVVSLLGRWASSRALAALRDGPDGAQRAQIAHHRNTVLLRGCVLGTFAVDLVVTGWCDVIGTIVPLQRIPGLAELVILSPFALATILVIVATYPIDRAIRQWVSQSLSWQGGALQPAWGLGGYLNFTIRHQLLAAFIPMSIILVAYELSRDYEAEIAALVPIPGGSDIALGLSAAAVFVLAPCLLKRIWTTQPLPQASLRRMLEALCHDIGLKCRNILIWDSGRMFVNAAVMGLFPAVRYVLLSDGLLASMSDKQIEAVFGHEAGHVRHRHIQFFLLFALASMLISSGVVELVYRGWGTTRLSGAALQGVGLLLITAIWAIGFGFVSRRFERQADLFGARCVTPKNASDCTLPCSVHSDTTAETDARGRLCATGARTFISALDRVAVLNGIPLDERSWRHSSIASRMDHLAALSADPTRVVRFERLIRRIKAALITVCVVGLAVSAYYVWPWFEAEWTRRTAMAAWR